MKEYWFITYLYEFIITFLIFYIIYAVFLNKKRKKNVEIDFLIKRYNLDIKKIGRKNLVKTLTLTNCFILSFIVVIFSKIESFILSVLISFILAMILIYSLYEIIGRYYKKKINKDSKKWIFF